MSGGRAPGFLAGLVCRCRPKPPPARAHGDERAKANVDAVWIVWVAGGRAHRITASGAGHGTVAAHTRPPGAQFGPPSCSQGHSEQVHGAGGTEPCCTR